MARVVEELSVGPPVGVDTAGQMRLRIQNKQINKPWTTTSPANESAVPFV